MFISNQNNNKVISSLLILAVAIVIFIVPIFAEEITVSQKGITLSRNHVSAWFESPLKPEHRNSKENLVGMINMVSGTFGTISIETAPTLSKLYPLEELPSNHHQMFIPSLAADHNRMSDPSQQLEVIVPFDLHPYSEVKENASLVNSFLVAKHYSDKANAIFPGTVQTLLLHHNDFFLVNGKSLLNHSSIATEIYSAWEFLNESTRDASSVDYKLGVTVSLDLCGSGREDNPNNFTKILSGIVHYVDKVFPVVYIKQDSHPNYDFHPDEEHEMQLAAFENCERILKKIKPEVEIIPIVICNPPKSRSVKDMSQFFQCWQLMSNWAEENNRKVIMYEAFDRFDDKKYATGVGWWRLKSEANNYELVNETSFIEKAKVDLDTRVKPEGITKILFDHRVRYVPHLRHYFEEEIKSMLEVVRTRFSTIVTSHKPFVTRLEPANSGSNVVFTNFTWVPELVAELNKENENAPSFKPLRVMFTFYRPDNNVWDPDFSFQNSLLDLEVALEVAKSTNEIFPHTVNSIAYHKLGNWNLLSDLETLRATLESELGEENSNSGFSIGTFVDLSACNELRKQFSGVKPWLNFIVVDLNGSSETEVAHKYPDSLLRERISELTECRKDFQREYPQVEIMVTVNCSEIARDPNKMIVEDMARCAHFIGEWGRENQMEVILSQAFDVPPASASEYTAADPNGGWWKLKKRSEVNITRESFVEKILDIGVNPSFVWGNGSEFSSNDYSWDIISNYDQEGSSSNTGYVVSIVILVLICAFLTVLVVYFYDLVKIKGTFRRDDNELQVLNEE